MTFLEKKISNLQLIVFDLDYTLWPFYIEIYAETPFQKRSNGSICDNRGNTIGGYKEVPQVIERLHKLGYKLAVASRTPEIKGAYELLNMLDWSKYFSYFEIYPGCKITHIRKISNDSGVPLSEILFFDDEFRNIRDLESIGTKSILVNEGVSLEVVSAGIQTFINRDPE